MNKKLLIGLTLILAIGAAESAPIKLTVNIPQVYLISGQDTAGDDELFTRVNIDGGGDMDSGIMSAGDGDTINPNWSFSSLIDPRGRSTYDVNIGIRLYDDDVTTEELIDINPATGRPISFSYNLQTQISSLVSPTTGNPPGDQATLYFKVTSDPFKYKAEVSTTILPGIFRYTLTNNSDSTFNLKDWTIPFIAGDLLPSELSPGANFVYDQLSYGTSFQVGESTVIFNDINNSKQRISVLIPIPEPSTLSIFIAGLGALVIVSALKNTPFKT